MNRSAAKTLGAAVLGAAFAATAAGTASAAIGPLPDTGKALDTVNKLPVDQVAKELPNAGTDTLTATRSAASTVNTTAPQVLQAARAANPLGSLLGGLPVNGLNKGLPVDGLGG
ncbi:ATP-binding protein [Streptomyces montanisoli]|uniref:ATP-binding protein n=1 Tax=Streptomyces montanisoli TaxID=2798581 RepID=A0A940RXB0_9ACTN|nr:ATP-binding protein [Streptomyces montanisoli]MBP0457958.1 ATP-binding protein [Streptomyces montanisoli]